MRTKRIKILVIAGGGIALVAIVALIATLSFDINSHKSKIESTIFETTGFNVKVNGRIGLSFFPFGVSAKDIHVAVRDHEILFLEQIKLGVELLPLLKRQIKITSCALVKPAVSIVKDLEGRYNFESREKGQTKGLPVAAFRLNDLELSKGTFLYVDKKTGEKTELKEINLAIKDLTVADISGEIIKNVSFTGNGDCKEILQKGIRIENLKASAKAIKGLYSFQPLTIGSIVYSDKKTGEKTELKEINLAIKDLTVADISGEIIKNVSFTGNGDCKEILQKGIRIENLKASAKAIKGLYSFQPLTIGSIVYSDKKTGEKTELKEINLAIKDLTVADISGEIIKNVSFTGNGDCKELRRKDLKIDSVEGYIRAKKGVFDLKPFTLYILGAKGKGDVRADKSQTEATYSINLNVPRLDFQKLQESFGAKKVIGGKVDLVASLTVKEKGGRGLLKGVYGTLSLQGNNLVTYAVDLDEVLSAYATSQKFSLLDIGAFFITGPLGPVALKGYRYGDLYYQTQGGRGSITKFVSRWKIRNGEADATDCALATRHNRVALKGKLNFVDERYDSVIVALLDDKGCAKFKQSISGPFSSPQVGVVSVAESLVTPFLNLFKQTKRFVQGGKCQVFYRGSVRQPR